VEKLDREGSKVLDERHTFKKTSWTNSSAKERSPRSFNPTRKTFAVAIVERREGRLDLWSGEEIHKLLIRLFLWPLGHGGTHPPYSALSPNITAGYAPCRNAHTLSLAATQTHALIRYIRAIQLLGFIVLLANKKTFHADPGLEQRNRASWTFLPALEAY
jgi:hypothetical protein